MSSRANTVLISVALKLAESNSQDVEGADAVIEAALREAEREMKERAAQVAKDEQRFWEENDNADGADICKGIADGIMALE